MDAWLASTSRMAGGRAGQNVARWKALLLTNGPSRNA